MKRAITIATLYSIDTTILHGCTMIKKEKSIKCERKFRRNRTCVAMEFKCAPTKLKCVQNARSKEQWNDTLILRGVEIVMCSEYRFVHTRTLFAYLKFIPNDQVEKAFKSSKVRWFLIRYIAGSMDTKRCTHKLSHVTIKYLITHTHHYRQALGSWCGQASVYHEFV